MVRSKYPNIADERTSVIFAVRGLQARQMLASHVPVLLMQSLRTFKELESAVELLATLERPRQPPRSQPPMQWALPSQGPPTAPTQAAARNWVQPT